MRLPDRFVDFLLISVGFAFALLVYNSFFAGGLGIRGMLLGTGASVLAFWATVEVRTGNGQARLTGWIGFVEQFCLGTGVNLLLHAVLTYALYTRRTPFLVGAGGLVSAALLTFRANLNAAQDRSKKRFLLIGFDSVAQKICGPLCEPLVGVVASQAIPLPADARWLGDTRDTAAILNQYRPTNVVVSMKDWSSSVSPSLLWDCRLSGVTVEEAPAVYERLFSRVCCERLQPVDLLLSSALRGDSRTMAIQSVYTNLTGLALLLALSPVILIVGFLIAAFSGPGGIFESFECAGFQYIPFRLLRFRTTRGGGSCDVTTVGRWISRLHLVNLPQLFNVVRGDMALVGPRPVRSEFARYLTELMPFYAHRFSVKPGILGWAQLHPPETGWLADECRQIEYDLFYVKEGSLWMDAEIVLNALGRGGTRGRSSPA
jgi:lipopolysaccharide/colanic/teichoic acid biosynthesis glycosyltransferase